MPRIYLNPSLQTYNLFVNGGTEEEYVNLVADAMEPYLLASGIEFTRNLPEVTISQLIHEANEGAYDLFFSIHTATAPPFRAGLLQGVNVLYYSQNPYGRELAGHIAENLEKVYPIAERVRAISGATMRELIQTRAPAVFVELGYNDNFEDAQWMKDSVGGIGRELARSIIAYFGMEFVEPWAD